MASLQSQAASLQSQAADSHALLRPPGLRGLQWRYGRCRHPQGFKTTRGPGWSLSYTKGYWRHALESRSEVPEQGEQGSLSCDSQFGFRASKWLAPALQPWVWAPKLESTPPSHPASVVGSRGQGQPWGAGNQSNTAELRCIPACLSWVSTAEEAERSSELLLLQPPNPTVGGMKGLEEVRAVPGVPAPGSDTAYQQACACPRRRASGAWACRRESGEDLGPLR